MKNFERERWRKLFIRENAQQRAIWPLMQRGIRDYCVRLADDDGTLAIVLRCGDPVEAVLSVLGAHPAEQEHARAAVAGLLEDGFLLAEDGRVSVARLAEAQGEGSEPGAFERASATAAGPPAPLSAAERARRYRAEQRRKRDATRDEASRSTVTERHETTRDAPSQDSVTVSRGNSQKEASEALLDSQKSQTNQTNSATGERDARDAVSVTVRDASPVTGARDIQALAAAYLRDEFTGRNGGIGGGVAENWPEVLSVFSTAAEAWGNPITIRGGLKDPRLKFTLERFAEGFTVERLQQAVRRAHFADYIANNQANQTLQTVLRDAGQVEKFAALTAPTGPRPLAKNAPRQPDSGYRPHLAATEFK